MAQDTKLFLDGVGELDLGVNIPIALNFSINEIQDISKRNSAFSKTIVLPGTKQNLEKLGFLFDVNIEFADATFEINRKVEAWVYQEGSVVLQGFFKLTNVRKLSPSDISYEQQIEFEAIIFGGQASFFDYVKLYDINSLNLSIYDHTLTWSAVTATISNTYLDGYKYIWHYCIQDNYNVGDFRPAMFIRTIWDKIFVDAGYSYYMDPTFQTNVFNKLLIPTNTRDLLITTDEQLARSAKIGYLPGTEQLGTGGNVIQSISNSNGIAARPFNLVNNTSGTAGDTALYLTSVQLEYDNDGSCFFNGSLNPYDTTTYIFTAQKKADYDVSIDMYGLLELTFSGVYFYPTTGGGLGGPVVPPRFEIYFDLQIRPAGSITWSSISLMSRDFDLGNVVPFDTAVASVTNNGYTSGSHSGNFEFSSQPVIISLEVGDSLRVMYRAILPGSGLRPQINVGGLQPFNATTYMVGGDNSGACDRTFFRIQSLKNTATEGDIFTLSSCLPQKIKMVDFIKSLAIMFNLYIDIDPNDPYRLIIKPRSVYYDYSLNNVVDWTDKISYSNEYSIELLSELQDRTLNFTYKPSKDEVNTAYFEGTKFYYGQYKVNFDNDFLTSEQKIESLFEPTPLVLNGSGSDLSNVTIDGKSFIVPYLIYGKDSQPKILIDGGIINTDQTYVVSGATTSPTGTIDIDYYAYAGHFDNPFTPYYDLNFNVNESYLYNEIADNLTENNLYNLYWDDYVNLISNSRLLTAYFNLNGADIKDLRFDVLYFIRDSYWLLNKVIDYDANEKKLTKCEFIKSINTPFEQTTTQKPKPSVSVNPTKPIKPWIGNYGKDEIRDNVQPGTTGNINNGNSSTIKGIKNTINIGTKNYSILGSFNSVGENVKGGSITGNNNLVGGDSDGINIIGNGNKIGPGSERITLINCDNVTIIDGSLDIFVQNIKNRTITKSDVAFVNPYVYFYQGYRVNNSDIVDGGEDIIFNPQNPFVDNVMDGLLDETFMMGVDGAQIIDGTYDSVDF